MKKNGGIVSNFELRRIFLDHLIHHRGQLSVFLRLLDVPIPGMYGPSADDAATFATR